jgi:hypothetical protein
VRLQFPQIADLASVLSLAILVDVLVAELLVRVNERYHA